MNITKVLTNNSPTILTGLSVAGLLTTTVLAVKSTPKAIKILDDYKDEDLTKKDVIKLTWKCYVPAAIMGTATIACMVGANSVNLRRNAALAGAYSIAQETAKTYRSKVVEAIGDDKERLIRDEVAKENISKNPVSSNDVVTTGKGEVLCFESLSGRYFKSDMEDIRRALNDVSRRLMNETYVSLNEVYYALDLEGTGMGDLLGFYVDDGLIEANFSSQISEDNRPCLVLDFKTEPRYYKRDY